MKSNAKTLIFSSLVRAATEDKELISLASLDKIKEFLPNIDLNENSDLLAIAFDACVVNRFNKNDHGINSQTATSIAKNFLFKPIDIEHKRTNIGGVILKYGFSTINHENLSEDEALNTKEPYYITLGGIIWKSIKPELSKYLSECSDPSSPHYQSVSASWELAFDTCKLILKDDNSRSIFGGEEVSEPDKIEEILKASKNGKYNGKRVYQLIDGGVLPIGVGLTENPAAEVKGVLTLDSNLEANEEVEESNSNSSVIDEKKTINIHIDKSINKIENIISHEIKNDVIKNIKDNMKLEKFDQITDDILKSGEVTASSIRKLFEDEITKISEIHAEKLKTEEKAKEDLKASVDTLSTENTNLKANLDSVKKTLDDVQKKIAEAEAQKAFDTRMEYFDTNFNLTADSKKILASELSSIKSDEEFKLYVEKMKVLLPAKTQEKVSTASVNTPVADPQKVVDDAISNGKTVSQPVPTSSVVEPATLREKYASAFALDQVEINIGRKK